MSNKAKDVINPGTYIFRTIFLYVGQGASTLLVVPDGDKHKHVLIDSNNDKECGGINIIKLLKDLFKDTSDKVDVYINTHPHKDHLTPVKEIYHEIGIEQVWHSGHKPGEDHKEAYDDLDYVMKKVGEKNVYSLKGSKEENKLDDKEYKLGDINYNVLAPASYVADDVADEKPEERYRRIHEQCGVIRFKFGKKEKQILITGDADYDAWHEHITDYHKDRLPSNVLSAAHHGSNSFFWKDSNTDEEPYKEHLNKIKPNYIVVSAPTCKESKHDHPDKEAMEKYTDEVGGDNLFHLGKNRECLIVDIDSNGDIDVYTDKELIKEYGFKDDDEGGKTERVAASVAAPYIKTKLDEKPMGI